MVAVDPQGVEATAIHENRRRPGFGSRANPNIADIMVLE
jgi:hypothetical protein